MSNNLCITSVKEGGDNVKRALLLIMLVGLLFSVGTEENHAPTPQIVAHEEVTPLKDEHPEPVPNG